MPRPEFNPRKTEAKGKNPLSAWIASRKERRAQIEEEASRMITNKTAQNEAMIVDQLNSIDFLHSRLPESVLNKKSREDQPCGDLEYAARGIAQMLIKRPQSIRLDIREIDKRLLTLVLLFKQAVEQGDVKAAYAAKGALVRGLNDIRQRIPANQPELAKQFVENNARYLDEWILLVGIAQAADATKRNLDARRKVYEDKAAEDQRQRDQLKDELTHDETLKAAWLDMMEHDLPEERTKWTAEQKALQKRFVDQRMKTVQLNLSNRLVIQHELDLSARESELDTLYTKVAALPINIDPNLMNKYRESLDQMFTELAKSDAELDEAMKVMDEIDGRLAQLDSAPGAIRAREIATEEALKTLEEIKAKQDLEAGQRKTNNDERLRRLGIRSEEEQLELRRQFEEEQARILEQVQEMQTEAQVLYN